MLNHEQIKELLHCPAGCKGDCHPCEYRSLFELEVAVKGALHNLRNPEEPVDEVYFNNTLLKWELLIWYTSTTNEPPPRRWQQLCAMCVFVHKNCEDCILTVEGVYCYNTSWWKNMTEATVFMRKHSPSDLGYEEAHTHWINNAQQFRDFIQNRLKSLDPSPPKHS